MTFSLAKISYILINVTTNISTHFTPAKGLKVEIKAPIPLKN